MALPTTLDRAQLIQAFQYGRDAVNEAIKEDHHYAPGGPLPQTQWPLYMGRTVTYIVVDPTSFAYFMGWAVPVPVGPSSKSEDEILAVIALAMLVFSSLAALIIAGHQTVKAVNFKESAERGREQIHASRRDRQLGLGEGAITGVNDRVERIYQNAAQIQSNIGNKKIAYAASALLICSGCVFLTATVALAVWGRPQFNLWALAGPGLAALGAGTISAIAARIINWLPPKEQVDQIDQDLHKLVETHRHIFTDAELRRLQT